MDNPHDAAIHVLKRLVSHTRLVPGGRWPCPHCGRKSIDAALPPVTVIFHTNGQENLTGCWYCNIEPILDLAKNALKRNGVDIGP